jgi:hypothetical protein
LLRIGGPRTANLSPSYTAPDGATAMYWGPPPPFKQECLIKKRHAGAVPPGGGWAHGFSPRAPATPGCGLPQLPSPPPLFHQGETVGMGGTRPSQPPLSLYSGGALGPAWAIWRWSIIMARTGPPAIPYRDDANAGPTSLGPTLLWMVLTIHRSIHCLFCFT